MEYINLLNESPIVWIESQQCYELYTPYGEIFIASDRKELEIMRRKVLLNLAYGNVCNCEHVRHFAPEKHDLPEWANIPRDGHKYMKRFKVPMYRHDYIGEVCYSCHRNCLGGW